MSADIRNLRKFRKDIEAARVEVTRLGNPTLHTISTMGLLAVEDKIVELGYLHPRTAPQVEALKRLIEAT